MTVKAFPAILVCNATNSSMGSSGERMRGREREREKAGYVIYT